MQVPNSNSAPPGKVSQQSTFDRGKSETIEVLKNYRLLPRNRFGLLDLKGHVDVITAFLALVSSWHQSFTHSVPVGDIVKHLQS